MLSLSSISERCQEVKLLLDCGIGLLSALRIYIFPATTKIHEWVVYDQLLKGLH